jgi:hypothetical protein
MICTNVYLDQKSHAYLYQQSHDTGRAISAVVREIIQNHIKVRKLLSSTDNIYSMWEDREFEVNDYVRELRKDRDFYGND